jgi:hypothetical protein
MRSHSSKDASGVGFAILLECTLICEYSFHFRIWASNFYLSFEYLRIYVVCLQTRFCS